MKNQDFWDEKHLMCFLYLSMALSDQVITPEEKRILDQKIKNLLNIRYQLPEIEQAKMISELQKFVNLDNDSQKELINMLSKKISLDTETYCLLVTELDEIAKANKFVSIEAHSFMYFVRLKFKKDYPSRQASFAA